jgi:transcriptional regulator with XRE-family HTH domain
LSVVKKGCSVPDMGTRRGYEPGPTAQRIRANLNQLRDQRRISLRALSKRLDRLGHPLLASGLSKIEMGTRRADVDDLVAIAIALDVAPNRLLLVGTAGEEKLELAPEAQASERIVWLWATGEAPLPVDLWSDTPGTIDLNRARRFRDENRPHDRSGQTPITELFEQEGVLAPAIEACREAVERSGLPREDVLHYVALALRMGELFGRKSEGEESGKH